MAVRRYSDGSVHFVFRRTKICFGEAKALLRGPGACFPRENFGKMDLNLAISCILGVKQSNCSMVRLQKNMQKVDKNIFRSLERTFVAKREVLPNPPNPPWERACKTLSKASGS